MFHRNGVTTAVFKFFNDETEWDLFKNVIYSKTSIWAKSKEERALFQEINETEWIDNTDTRPDFISDNLMIEMFEIDDIVTTKKGRDNPQRKADARALRDVKKWLSEVAEDAFNDDVLIVAHGDTRYNPTTDSFTPDDSVSHHSYQAYVNNFIRICQKHLDSIDAYKKNFPNKRLGFFILDDSTYYVKKKEIDTRSLCTPVRNLPFFDKNFMKLLIKSEVEFVLWAFNNKYVYTDEHPHGEKGVLPEIVLLTKDNYYTKYSRYFDISSMVSLEE